MDNLTHWKKLTNPDYIGAYSLDPAEERTVEIVKVVRQMVNGADGKKEECTVAHLKGEKPFILNKTNCKILTSLYGTPYIEQWIGKQIVIYAAKVKAFGEVVDALRIKNAKPHLPDLNPSSAKWNGAIEAIKNGSTTMAQIEQHYTLTAENKQLLTQSTDG